MSYTIEDLRGKYVEVGTPECEVFLDACEELGVKWASGSKPRRGRWRTFTLIFMNQYGAPIGASDKKFSMAAPFIIKPTWTAYNNDKPLHELSDEQVGKLVKHGGEVELFDGKYWYTVRPEWLVNLIYRAKQKSERELFIEKGLAVYESDEVGGNVESLLGVMFDADFKAPKGGE